MLAGGYGGDVSPFNALAGALAGRAWRADRVLPFSYGGGSVVGGEWRPAPYGCDATAAPVT